MLLRAGRLGGFDFRGLGCEVNLKPTEQRDEELLLVGPEDGGHRAFGREVLRQQTIEQLLARVGDHDERHAAVDPAPVAPDQLFGLERVEDRGYRGPRHQKAICDLVRIHPFGRLAEDDKRIEAGQRQPITPKTPAQRCGDQAVRADQVDQHLRGAPLHLRKLPLEGGGDADRSVEVLARCHV